MDIWYQRFTRSRFSGMNGTDDEGAPAINAQSFYQWIVLTPCLEYNISATQGLIGGLYVTVSGHNTYKIVNAVVSYEVLF